jgi:hypothetical protein
MREVVMPLVMEQTGGDPGEPPVESWYELHNLVVPE